MSLDYLKVNISSGNSLDTPPEEFYRNYTENPPFFDTFEKVMVLMNSMIKENFSDCSITLYGRIKSENSYFQKTCQKDRIFDIYAFKVIVENVGKSHEFDEDLINDLKADFLNSNLDINSNDFYNIALAKEISNSFADYALPHLKDVNALSLTQRSKDYLKDNGFVSFLRTLKTYPDRNKRIPCNIEFQCRSARVDFFSPFNHHDYKKKKYGSDISTFPRKEFDKCNSLDEFDCLCRKCVPCYVYLKNNKLVKVPNYANFLHSYSIYLFEKTYDSDGNSKFTHQKDLDKLNHFMNLTTYNSRVKDWTNKNFGISDKNNSTGARQAGGWEL